MKNGVIWILSVLLALSLLTNGTYEQRGLIDGPLVHKASDIRCVNPKPIYEKPKHLYDYRMGRPRPMDGGIS